MLHIRINKLFIYNCLNLLYARYERVNKTPSAYYGSHYGRRHSRSFAGIPGEPISIISATNTNDTENKRQVTKTVVDEFGHHRSEVSFETLGEVR